MTNKPDFIVNDNGSRWSVVPVTRAAKKWFDENVYTEDWQWLGPTCVVDWRFGHTLSVGIADAGFTI